MILNVTVSEIWAGCRHDAYSSPISLAAKKEYPEANRITTSDTLIWVWSNDRCIATFPLTQAIMNWQKRYDRGEFVEPFKVILEELK